MRPAIGETVQIRSGNALDRYAQAFEGSSELGQITRGGSPQELCAKDRRGPLVQERSNGVKTVYGVRFSTF